MWQDVPRQLIRRARKATGLPASSDVGILAELLQQLRERAESHISQSVGTAVVAYSALLGLYTEAISYATDYLRVRALTGYFFNQPRHIFAAYSGHGMGMCDHGGDYSHCRDELLSLPVREVLLVECASQALLLHVEKVRAATDTADPDVTATVALDEGQGENNSPLDPPRLNMEVLQVLQSYYRLLERPKEMTVIISGDRAHETLIVTTVIEA
ncbi:MAG: hypothetical protein Q9162_000348, partial [Coniocarpon cinnabarinum]